MTKIITIPITFWGFTQLYFNTAFYGILVSLPFIYSQVPHFGFGMICVGEFLIWIECLQVGWLFPKINLSIRWKSDSEQQDNDSEK